MRNLNRLIPSIVHKVLVCSTIGCRGREVKAEVVAHDHSIIRVRCEYCR